MILLRQAFPLIAPCSKRPTMFESLMNRLHPRKRRRLSVQDSPAAELAAQMLHAPAALIQLSADDARRVVSYMEPYRLLAGQCFMREGQTEDTDYMLLILEGDVMVENFIVSRRTPITTAVIGAGALVGELGLLDGSARSATCTTCTDVLAAKLTRQALGDLLEEDPTLGVKLLLAIGVHMSNRVRERTDKLKSYAALIQTMQQEMDRLIPS
ncbi:cyclic nucleotide-binding domain-containing protein [Curvibacter sp. RS43]|uniref:Cyclic nucleotide-binding domain-containing protein n=2 Tax=Curvibacter microcysteis TaxID=3026419 RepID=A0ABT5MFL4_9BURK|nr:cyclic nucleotide-binding domain-containing protein [Curvibacter sp. RS43]MDD0811157.1 cyclic nucleotide-binding domain-containing protein [Curvibacter sp. RS43]MDD0813871.1 cyclic nucleotide-binding domain-containing protein [Curvibacter sp. HBC28]